MNTIISILLKYLETHLVSNKLQVHYGKGYRSCRTLKYNHLFLYGLHHPPLATLTFPGDDSIIAQSLHGKQPTIQYHIHLQNIMSTCHTPLLHATHHYYMPHTMITCHTPLLHATHHDYMPHTIITCHTPLLHATHHYYMPHTIITCHTPLLHATHHYYMPHIIITCHTS